MQIRIQGRRIQCIRSEYDPSIKRCRQRVVAFLPSWASSIKDGDTSVLSALTDDERQELIQWLGERQERQETISRGYRARTIAKTLQDLTEDIKSGAWEVTQDYAAALWKELNEVGKALRKAGHPKPTRPRKVATSEIDSRQADLLE